MTVFSLEEFRHIKGLCLSPLKEIQQAGRKLRLIYDFTHISPNEKFIQASPKSAIQFSTVLHRLINCTLNADLELGPVSSVKWIWHTHICTFGYA